MFLRITFLGLVLLGLPAYSQTMATSLYLQAEVYETLLPHCKQLLPQKKLLLSSHLQSWKADNRKDINKGREDMINLATMLGKPVSFMTQQKVDRAMQQWKQADQHEKQATCLEMESL